MRSLLAPRSLLLTVLCLLLDLRNRPAEYRVLGRLAGLEAGTPVVVHGLQVGYVPNVRRRADTTFVRFRLRQPVARPRAGDAVRLRRMGLRSDSLTLEIVRTPRRMAELPRGGWLKLAPPVPDPADNRLFSPPLRVEPEWLPPYYRLPLAPKPPARSFPASA